MNDLWRFWWPSSTSLQQDTLKKFTETIIVCICQALGEILCYLLFNFILSTALVNGFFFHPFNTQNLQYVYQKTKHCVILHLCFRKLRSRPAFTQEFPLNCLPWWQIVFSLQYHGNQGWKYRINHLLGGGYGVNKLNPQTIISEVVSRQTKSN